MERNTWISDLHWVREGQQDRSRKTQAKLLDAAEELFAVHGIEGATIAEISKGAGCSIGAFYHHYRDKRAIQFALFERFTCEYGSATTRAVDAARWQGARICDVLQGYLQLSLVADRSMPNRRPAAMELARVEPGMLDHLIKLRGLLDEGVRDLLLARRSEIGHPDPELAVTFVLDQLGSMLRSRMSEASTLNGFAARSDEEFVTEAVRSTCRYLQVELPAEI